MGVPPSTPSACAETPTQASPSSMSSGLRYIQSGADSPSDSFIHSTTTVPLKWAGLAGRRTMIRVLYAADVVGAMLQFPLDGAEVAVKAWAVPEAKYSCST